MRNTPDYFSQTSAGVKVHVLDIYLGATVSLSLFVWKMQFVCGVVHCDCRVCFCFLAGLKLKFQIITMYSKSNTDDNGGRLSFSCLRVACSDAKHTDNIIETSQQSQFDPLLMSRPEFMLEK